MNASALSGSRSLCRNRCAARGRSYRPFASVPARQASSRTPAVRPPAAATPAAGAAPTASSRRSEVSAERARMEKGEAAAAAAAAAALLQWACSGWSGPERRAHADPDPDDGGPAEASTATGGSGGSGSGFSGGFSGGGSGPLELRVVARDLGPGRGRGLVAAVDVAGGETLLSVPLTRVFTSDPDSDLHWSAEMALRLLRARHLAAAAQHRGTAARGGGGSQARGGEGEGEGGGPESLGEAGWGPWIRALPSAVRTPLEYGEEEVRQLGCPYVMEEVRLMQQCVRDCFEVLQPELSELGCGWGDFLWAVQIFHSRCFFEPSAGLHMCVPGVDLANHSPTQPSAQVRLRHSPGACQGYDALAEVAEPPPPEPSRFELVACEEGIRAGQEVTISYGRWPSEAFLLLFGFVPAAAEAGGNEGDGGSGGGGGGGSGTSPGECLTVFRDAEEAVRWCVAAAAAAQQAHQAQQRPQQQQQQAGPPGEEEEEHTAQVQAILRAAEESMPDESFFNLTVTAQGVDGRLQGLLEVAARHLPGLGPRDMLLSRLKERLAHFGSVDGDFTDDAIRQFVRSKQAVAQGVLARL
ncbi:hypothetical protein PLESTB_000970800 [Pleodorina starrii]|uniref:SET domain-containing protein n=1 Tax=Pleodorina starrii TaxID=330485 RepID=A0A9W6BNB9_9CHLO|nr:hypothetical protein PLESTM_001636600 [Pleodorina starrii]GLC55307.1 hypothetical protein PLESTB_000970800 [Pleodorina starrii]GLC77459.1 hypothetical protein PLESTF_001938200 [Pleodorina starrii]